MLNNKNDEEFRCTIEHLIVNDGNLSVQGWAYHPAKEIMRIYVEIGDQPIIELKHHLPRTDVAERFGSEQVLKSGFFGFAPLPCPTEVAYLVFSFNDAGQEKMPLDLKGVRPWKCSYPVRMLKKGSTLISKVPLLFGRRNRSTAKILLYQLLKGHFRYLFSFARQVVDEHEHARTDLAARQTLLEAYARLPYLVEALSCLKPAPADVTPLPQPVDVIVPIYNGVDFLPRLLDSLFAHNDSCHRIILIDDASPDQRVWPMLQKYSSGRQVTLIRNDQNLGFVRTVNKAVQGVKNHFVLLNSDVEVPPGWLERLMKPIFDHPDRIASTTPFSNAATICSFPDMNVDNELFADLPVTRIDRFFQGLQPDTELEIPTGVGFCMGFNHGVVQQIGMFDAETFGMGFGEENDWCQRATAVGFRNILVPNLFVYHQHGGSFLDAKKPQLEANLQKLKYLHPNYFEAVREFCLEDPPGPWRAAMILKMAGSVASSPPLLIVDHDIGGGANRYRARLIDEALKRDSAVLLLLSIPRSDIIYVIVSYRRYRATLVLKSPEDLQALTGIIPIGDIFYNNLVGYADPLAVIRELLTLKKKAGATLTMAIHDFFPICPAYTLIDKNNAYCHPAAPEFCKTCLPENDLAAPVPDPDPTLWREKWAEALTTADTILVFSHSSREILTSAYPSVRDKIILRPHEPMVVFTRKPAVDVASGIHVGVVGGINVPKGRNIVAALAKTMTQKKDPRMSLTVLGSLSPPLREKSLCVTGPYQPQDLPDLIENHGLNVFLIPSIWPETFSFVAQELMDMDLPVCCFNLGAPAERIRDYHRGLVLSGMEPGVILEEIEAFLKRLEKEAR